MTKIAVIGAGRTSLEMMKETEKRDLPVDNIVSASGTPKAQYALDRMKRAYDKGRGIRLSWEELDDFSRTSWSVR